MRRTDQQEEGHSLVGSGGMGAGGGMGGVGVGVGVGMVGVEETLAALTRRDGERRTRDAALAALAAQRSALTAQLAAAHERLADYQVRVDCRRH